MVTDIVKTISALKSETLFIPPILLGYIGYMFEYTLIYISAFVSLVGAVYLYEIMEYIDELGDNEELEAVEVLLLFPQNRFVLYLFIISCAWYFITIFGSYVYGLYALHVTDDFYLFLGITGYTLWLLLMFTSISLSEEPTEPQLRAIEGYKTFRRLLE